MHGERYALEPLLCATVMSMMAGANPLRTIESLFDLFCAIVSSLHHGKHPGTLRTFGYAVRFLRCSQCCAGLPFADKVGTKNRNDRTDSLNPRCDISRIPTPSVNREYGDREGAQKACRDRKRHLSNHAKFFQFVLRFEKIVVEVLFSF